MKCLAIFQYQDLQTAKEFKDLASAEKAIKACATAAKTKALKSTDRESYILENNGREISVEIQEIDAEISYQLNYNNNGATETSSYDTHSAAEKAAEKIVDDLGYNGSADEKALGHWTIDNPEANLTVDLKIILILKTKDQDTAIADYNAVEPKFFCTHLDEMLAEAATVAKTEQSTQLKDARKSGWRNLFIGIAIAAAGGLLTLISYANTKPGSTYHIYTGLIVVGIVDAFVGLYYVIRPKAALKTPKNRKK